MSASNKCATQPEDIAAIVVGIGNEIPRWDTRETGERILDYYVHDSSFPPGTYAEYAASEFKEAASEWNAIGFGVKFRRTLDPKLAHFNLVYSVNSQVLARAFFPHQSYQDVIITDTAFSPRWIPTMKNTFLHEIGHILGLRHEFAVEKEGFGAVQFMKKNPKSVMAYYEKQTIQASDIEAIKEFYKLDNGAYIWDGVDWNWVPIVDYLPTLRNSD